jgi:hypothetical protein
MDGGAGGDPIGQVETAESLAGDRNKLFTQLRDLCTKLTALQTRNPNRICIRLDFEWVDASFRPTGSPLYAAREIPTPSRDEHHVEIGSTTFNFITMTFSIVFCEAGGSVLIGTDSFDASASGDSAAELMPPPPPRPPKMKAPISLPEDKKKCQQLRDLSLQMWLSTLEWAKRDSGRLTSAALRSYLGERVPKQIAEALHRRLLDLAFVEIIDGLRYIDRPMINAEIRSVQNQIHRMDTIPEGEEVLLLGGTTQSNAATTSVKPAAAPEVVLPDPIQPAEINSSI